MSAGKNKTQKKSASSSKEQRKSSSSAKNKGKSSSSAKKGKHEFETQQEEDANLCLKLFKQFSISEEVDSPKKLISKSLLE